jgi:hypothetical protein
MLGYIVHKMHILFCDFGKVSDRTKVAVLELVCVVQSVCSLVFCHFRCVYVCVRACMS